MKNIVTFLLIILPGMDYMLAQEKDSSIHLNEDFEQTSFVQLISNPSKYHKKRVQIFGYLHVKFEDFALYMSKEDADYLNDENSAWVEFDSSIVLETIENIYVPSLDYFDSKYVTVEGFFNCEKTFGSSIGTIESIERMFESRQWYDGEKELWEIDNKGFHRKNKNSNER